MCFDCEGSSPSQMIAVCLPRLARCRSMQLWATLSTPSSNHLIEMLPGANETFSILVGAFIQSRRASPNPPAHRRFSRTFDPPTRTASEYDDTEAASSLTRVCVGSSSADKAEDRKSTRLNSSH